jgi:hypothetical protein
MDSCLMSAIVFTGILATGFIPGYIAGSMQTEARYKRNIAKRIKLGVMHEMCRSARHVVRPSVVEPPLLEPPRVVVNAIPLRKRNSVTAA